MSLPGIVDNKREVTKMAKAKYKRSAVKNAPKQDAPKSKASDKK